MTAKLYYGDSHLAAFTARVEACEKTEKGYEILLDRTAFYPEGGGQPSDRGSLGHARVLEVRQREGEIVHLTDAPLPPEETVRGEIDWDRRLDHMQQHSGEHILSGLICAAFGCDNVGFHMGRDRVVIDFNVPLAWEPLRELEEEANRLIWADLPVEIGFYEGEELEKLHYRSKKPLEGPVRIVTFPGADTCACCGTHVGRTGEIGVIRLLSVHPLRGGSRVEMVCGERAWRYLTRAADANHAVSVALSAPEGETPAALGRVLEEFEALKVRNARLEDRLFQTMAQHLSGPQLLFEPELSPDALRRLCLAVGEGTGERCAAFSGREGEYQYALYLPKGDTALAGELNAALRGRGGGRDGLCQGRVRAAEGEIRAFFRTLE